MAKIRMNNTRRNILHRLIQQVVADTPIDKDVEERVAKARADYKAKFATLAKLAMAAHKKAYPAADLKVLKKHDTAYDTNDLYFVDLDTRMVFDVDLFDKKSWDRDNYGMPITEITDWEDRQAAVHKRSEASDKKDVMVATKMTRGAPAEAPTGMMAARAELKEAGDELNVAERADGDMRDTIKRDFTALVNGARTYEDVIAVWPEAKKVAGEMAETLTALSVMSTDAVERIQENMAKRGVAAE